MEDNEMGKIKKSNIGWMAVASVILTIGMLLLPKNLNTEEVIQEDAEIEQEVVEEASFNVSDEMYSSAAVLFVEKVVRTQIEHEDGSIETQYDSYVQSELNLIEGQDITTDYTNASIGENIDLEKVITAEFKEAFGFDYRGMNGVEVYNKLLMDAGIDGNLNEVTFDETTHEMTGQEIYVLEDECEVTNMLLKDETYDTLVGMEVSYQMQQNTEETVEPNNVPEFFTAMVQYELDGSIITKNLFLQIAIQAQG